MKTKTKKEIKNFLSSGEEIEILNEFKYENEIFVNYFIKNTWGDIEVVNKNRLVSEENTAKYKLNKEIETLVKEKEKQVKLIQDEAIKKLTSRIRLNLAFSESDPRLATITLGIIKELENIIKK